MFGNKISTLIAVKHMIINLNNSKLTFIKSIKNLGVFIDNNIKFKENSNNLFTNLLINNLILFKLDISYRQFLNFKLYKKMLCKTLIKYVKKTTPSFTLLLYQKYLL